MPRSRKETQILQGGCLEILKTLGGQTIDAVVTDPPYELEFMNKAWDGQGIAFSVELWREILRLAKPGAHLVAFGGTRTSHRMVCAIEDAGWEIRDSLMWMHGQGFPKNRATQLKPAHEPICLARKALVGTVAECVERWGTGAINVDACRIGTEGGGTHCPHWPNTCRGHDNAGRSTTGETKHGDPPPGWPAAQAGRWPANVVLDEEGGAALDEQTQDKIKSAVLASVSATPAAPPASSIPPRRVSPTAARATITPRSSPRA